MSFSRSRGFTLVELLVVISVLSVLSTAVVIVLNPTELLKRSRDSRRINDIGAIERAIASLEADKPLYFNGDPLRVYISIPDDGDDDDGDLNLDDCDELGLPALPPTFGDYHCSTAANLRRVDGAGWIPVDFTTFSAGSPLSSLPVDPINTLSSGYYYAYVPGSFKLTALLESKKELSKMKDDGGPDPALFEKGNDLNLANFQRGLAGYWKLENNFSDSSGVGSNGIVYGAPFFSAGKVGQAGNFNGSSDYAEPFPNSYHNPGLGSYSVLLWMKSDNVTTGNKTPFSKKSSSSSGYPGWIPVFGSAGKLSLYLADNASNQVFVTTNTVFSLSNWYHVAFTINRTDNTVQWYVNGVKDSQSVSISNLVNITGGNLVIAASCCGVQSYFDGLLDDLRIYKRALSEQEIKTIYEVTK